MCLHMRLVKSNDFYSIKVRGYVTSLHLDVLDLLYQPIMGFSATSIYRYLYATRDFRSGDPLSFALIHNHLGFTYDQISMAINRLEGLGLVRSFLVSRPEFNEFVLELFAPKDPASFSKDAIFMHLLQDILGPRHTQELIGLFMLDAETINQEEVTADFASIYGPQVQELNGDDLYTGQTLENVVGSVKIPFDEVLFFNLLTKIRKILPTALSKNEVKILKQIAGLYDLTEEALANKVGDFYNAKEPFGKRVDISAMRSHLQELIKYPTISKTLRRRKTQVISGDSANINMINNMEKKGPIDFLMMLNEGTKIAPADQKILEDLAVSYNLTPPVINALIFYTLKYNNNQLIRALIEKNASFLSRSKVSNALDALDILERPPVAKKGRKPKQEETPEKEELTPEAKNDLEDPIWDELKDL